ncbi:MAG: thiamine-phosphate kinase, partial [Acidobacteriota bacterium]
LRCGMGDDAALLETAGRGEMVLTTDLLLEKVHFRLDWTPPELLGHKALSVNLSDLAAMGAEPEVFLLELGLPPAWPVAALEAFLAGMDRLARRVSIALAGGDVSASGRLHIGVTAVGRVEPGRALRRRGAQPGDDLAVTGPLGAAGAGYQLLQEGFRLAGKTVKRPLGAKGQGRLNTPALSRLLRAHLAPEAELEAGWALATVARAGLDLSDGLGQDLPTLCEASGLGAEVFRSAIPVNQEARLFWESRGRDPIVEALAAGEDYHLLVALPPEASWHGPGKLARIGRLTARAEVRLVEDAGWRPWPRTGFQHF